MAEKQKLASRIKTLWAEYGFGNKPMDVQAVSDELPAYDGFHSHAAVAEFLRDKNNQVFDVDEFLKTQAVLPANRLDRYARYDLMAANGLIDNALNQHLDNALGADAESGQIFRIESVGGKESPEAKMLREDLSEMVNDGLRKWMYGAIKNGVKYVRPAVAQGKGVISIRDDFYTRPDMIKEFEIAGQTVGYLHKTDIETHSKGKVQLFEPWKFLSFKLESLDSDRNVEPQWKDKQQFNIRADAPDQEAPIETQNYGRSLLETAYEEFVRLSRAIQSLDVAREKAGRKERFVTVDTANQNPTMAAKVYGQLVNIFQSKKSKRKRKEYETGARSSVETTIIPTTGQVSMQTEVNDVNIAHIEDMDFRVSLLASSLYLDKALMGFTNEMHGGLGDGGFYTVSAKAANYAIMLRTVAAKTLNELFKLHLFFKTGKVYPKDLPWKIVFNTSANAVAREQQQNHDSKVSSATLELTLVQQADPNWEVLDREAYVRHLFTNRMSMSDQEFETLRNKNPKKAEGEDGESAAPSPSGPPVFDDLNRQVEEAVYRTILNLSEEEA